MSLAIPDAGWKEIFNSDAAIYGGQNVGNSGAMIPSTRPTRRGDPGERLCGLREPMMWEEMPRILW